MINNYDSFDACYSSGSTTSQKQGDASYTAKKRTWLSFLTVFVALFSFVFAQGQSTANYAFSTNATGSLALDTNANAIDMSTGSVSLVPAGSDQGVSAVTNIGFNYYFYGNVFSQFSVSANGILQLGPTAVSGSTYVASDGTIAAPKFSAIGSDAITASSGDAGGITSKVVGTSPNRCLVVQWVSYLYWLNTASPATFQVRLYETSGVVEYVYGSMPVGATSYSSNYSSGFSAGTLANQLACITTSTNVVSTSAFTTNAYTAATNIVNLHSTANGSRRIYNFTPASSVATPTTLTFSGLTSAGTTVNWVDNSTTEYGFLVTRATDAAFTTGVVTTTVASTTTAAIGGAINSIQTGLLPSTIYYYKVKALTEAAISSEISGSQVTNAPGTFVSIATGNWGAGATWDAGSVPTAFDSATVSTGHVVTAEASITINDLTINGTLNYASAATSATVKGSLTVSSGGLVNVFNNTIGKSLLVAGNITNNGRIDLSVSSTTSVSTEGRLTLNGSTVQTVAGTGAFGGTVSVAGTTNTVDVIRYLTCANTSTATPNIIWSFNNVKLMNGINLTGARINLGTNKLILGNFALAEATVTMPINTGFLSGGKFSRWWPATGTGSVGTGITAGSDPTGTGSRYPFVSVNGYNRAMYVNRTDTTGAIAGELAVVYNDAATNTSGLSIVDGTYTVTNRYDGNWSVSTEGTAFLSSSFTVVLMAQNTLYPANGNARVIAATTAISGVHQNGTITPGAQRKTISQTDLLAGPLYIGVAAADIPFISITNGDWENASTWNKNAVPSATDVVYIVNGTTVAVNATAAVSNAMTIFAGGTLNVAGSTLGVTTSVTNNGTLNVSGGSMSTTTTVTNNASSTITVSGTGTLSVGTTLTNNGIIYTNAGNLNVTGGSATGITNSSTGTFVVAGGTVRQGPVGGGNTMFTNAGILTVSSGTLSVNGNLVHSGTQFNQSGGNINIDPNAAGVVASSTTSSNYTLNLTSSSAGSLNWTGGTLTIVDPPASTSTSHYSIYYAMNANSEIVSGHNLQFGDGVSSEIGGSTNGFYIYNYVGSYKGNFNNIFVNGPSVGTASSTNRIVKQKSYSNNIYGDLTINNNGEFDMNVLGTSIGRNLNVNTGGVLTASGTLSFALPSGTGIILNANNSQAINGGGTIRNLSSLSTANLTGLQFGNSNSGGITLNVPLSVSGTLTMSSGLINTTNTNLLTLGTATAAGTLSGTPSATNMVKGPFARTIASANANTNYILFPVGKTAYAPISLAPATTAVTVMKAEVFDTNTGTQNPSIVNMSSTRRWEAPIVSGTVTNVNVLLADAAILATSIPVQAPTATGEYTNAFGSVATAVAGVTTQSNTAATGANYTGFLSFATSNACSGTPAPGNTIASSNAICLGTTVTLSLQNVPSGTGVTYQWKSSIDGTTYTAITGATNATLIVTPTEAAYYLCDVTCSAGPATGTSTAVQITFANSITASTPATRCGVGTVTLGATPSTGATVNWYSALTGGASLGSGTSFTTPSIAATTTFYASAETISNANVALGSTAAISTAFGTTSSTDGGMIFSTTTNNVAINSIDVLVAGTGDLTIKLQNSSGVDIASTSVTGFTGSSTALTNIVLPSTFVVPTAGVGYKLLCTSLGTGLSWYYQTGAYPYTTPGVSITSGWGWAATTTDLRFIHKMNLTVPTVCSSARMPIVATVTTPPTLTLSSSAQTICNGATSGTVTVTSTATDFDTYVWTPTTGVTGNSTTGFIFNPTATTNYTLLASQTAGTLCSNAATVMVTVNPLPSVMSFSPVTPSVCIDSVLPISVNGGTIGVVGKVGSGTATNTTSTPFKGYYGGSKTQALYTAAELTTLGMAAGQKISSIGYVALSGTPLVLNSFTISAGFVSSTTLGSVFVSGASNVVLAPVNYTPTTGTGNLDFALSTPLLWDGVSNLLVETCFNNNNGGGSSSNSISIQSSTVASGLNLYRSQDSTVDVCSNATAPSSSTNRPNLRISTLEPTTITWSPVTNLYTNAAATTAYTSGTNASTVYVKSATAGTVTYTVTATAATGCTRTATVDVVVNALPTVATVNPAAVCSPSTVDLTASAVTAGSDTGLVYTYWTNASATTALTTASAVTTSGTYYIKGTNANGCSVVTPVTVTVNPLPVLSITNPATVCFPSTVDLTLAAVTTGSDSVGFTLSYFTDAAATLALVAPTAVTTSGTYYIKSTNNTTGCEKIMPVVVTINVTNVPTGTAAQAFCGSANLSQLAVTGSNVKWYNAATAGTEYPASLWTVIGLVNATTYYATQTVNGCESVDRFAVTVTINAFPSAPNAAAQTFCGSATVADLAPAGTSLKWYDVATAGVALTSTTALVTGTYYVSQISNTCEGPRTAVAVTINVTAAPTGAAIQDSCTGTIVDFIVSGGSGAVFTWYATNTSTVAIPTTTTAVINVLYYVSQTINGCEGPRLEILASGPCLGNEGFDLTKFSYYPNPTNDFVNVTYSDEITQVKVFNMLGQQVIERKVNATTTQVDMSKLASGTYFLEVTSNEVSKTVKVIKN
ncbi:MAG: T9SS type A sorting domain-containing protein [Flavobacterium sp.]